MNIMTRVTLQNRALQASSELPQAEFEEIVNSMPVPLSVLPRRKSCDLRWWDSLHCCMVVRLLEEAWHSQHSRRGVFLPELCLQPFLRRLSLILRHTARSSCPCRSLDRHTMHVTRRVVFMPEAPVFEFATGVGYATSACWPPLHLLWMVLKDQNRQPQKAPLH